MPDTPFTIPLSAKVRDRITGFTGRVVSRTQFIGGCNRYYVQPEMEKKLKELPKGESFDEIQLEVLDSVSVIEKLRSKLVAGPGPG